MEKQNLEQIVREAVQQILARRTSEAPASTACAEQPGAETSRPKITLVYGTTVGLEKFEPYPGVNSRLADLINSKHGSSVAVGLMEVRECTFDWTLNYEEVDYVLDGTLDIIVDGVTYRGHKGDALFIPKGTHVQFSSPDRALFLYCTYPADWANQ